MSSTARAQSLRPARFVIPPDRQLSGNQAMMQRIEKTFAGRQLVIETGRMAKQAAGSASSVRRHHGPRRRHGQRQAKPARLLPAPRRVPREDVRRRQDSRRLHQARRSPERRRDPLGPHHRSFDSPALPGRLQERSPGLHLRHLRGPGERARRARARRRICRAERVEDSVRRRRLRQRASAGSRTSGC